MKRAAAILATMIATGTAAFAQDICMPDPELEAGLIDWYGEAPVEGAEKATAQMWAAEETGTWTLVQYLADGNSCVLAQGNDWAPARSEDLLLAALSE